MPGNSLNLVDFIHRHLSTDFIDRMSSFLGESIDKTRMGVNAAVPGLLASFDRVASTTDGTRRITAAVDDADDTVLDNPASYFSKTLSSESGSGILRSILGIAGLNELADSVARSTGLSGKTVTSLLGLLGPLAFAAIRRA